MYILVYALVAFMPSQHIQGIRASIVHKIRR